MNIHLFMGDSFSEGHVRKVMFCICLATVMTKYWEEKIWDCFQTYDVSKGLFTKERIMFQKPFRIVILTPDLKA